MSEEANTAVWDDSLLVKTYDQSVGLAREALARRLADSTNKREEENAAADEEAAEDSATGGAPSEEPMSFKVGDYARATYVDGLDYEGAVVSINEEKGTCIIRYLGYENEQEVLLLDLLPTWGKRVRREQFLEAKKEESSPGPAGQLKSHKSSIAAAGTSKNLKSGGRLVMPPMPPVPPMIAGQGDGAEQDFVAMLTAWYMSGYYTGLYQGKKEANTNTSAKKKTPKK
ncbi:survival motor neuron protein [Drosophila subpulchrella]|uniref:survival motor neuron protein n=1 Tax=Drosophila subpulchrella TaxID=1486046 RepID=UPI0018A15DF3|nr:survival motor neuron protein [Drosophila subpulchrella]